MNSVLQALANTPFIREYFCGIILEGELFKSTQPIY